MKKWIVILLAVAIAGGGAFVYYARSNNSEPLAAGATVIGMSGDDIEGLKKFSVSECRDKFAVARADDKIIEAYQVRMSPGLAMTNRTSYVIDREGRIVFVHSATKPQGHVTGTLAKVKALSKS